MHSGPEVVSHRTRIRLLSGLARYLHSSNDGSGAKKHICAGEDVVDQAENDEDDMGRST